MSGVARLRDVLAVATSAADGQAGVVRAVTTGRAQVATSQGLAWYPDPAGVRVGDRVSVTGGVIIPRVARDAAVYQV